MFFSERYAIQDCGLYHPDEISYTTTSGADTTYPTGLTYEFTPDGDFEYCVTMKLVSATRLYLTSKNNSTIGSIINYGLGLSDTNNQKLNVSIRTTTTQNNQYGSGMPTDSWADVRITRINNLWSIYANDTLLVDNISIDWWDSKAPFIFVWAIWTVTTARAKNIKIKAL